MNHSSSTNVLPYTLLVGQEQLKLALELAYIAPRIGGVLISGQRGTGKSTAVRAFAQMMYNTFPITLPINATEDRVVGGWKINELMRGQAEEQIGLLEEANDGILYIDEVNLLDDHIVNIILDVTSTGVLVVQREGRRSEKQVSFTLIGTMNPEEGGLRPQLLDRFGLMVNVTSEIDEIERGKILQTVIAFDEAIFRLKQGQSTPIFDEAGHFNALRRDRLEQARQRLYSIDVSDEIVKQCVAVATQFQSEGHRGDYVMALAARALAALQSDKAVTTNHLKVIAPLALQHRRTGLAQSSRGLWTLEDDQRVVEILDNA